MVVFFIRGMPFALRAALRFSCHHTALWLPIGSSAPFIAVFLYLLLFCSFALIVYSLG